jgi:hypothetical protein
MTQTAPSRMEVACSLLAESERRYLLYQLAENSRGNLEEIVETIASWELDDHEITADSDQRQRIYVSLAHNHLPRLADYDIIDYDLRSGDVVLGDGFDDIRPLLSQFKQTEERPELREQPLP